MAKYLVNVSFRDKTNQEVVTAGSEVELAVKRANEIIAKLGEDALERIDDKKEKDE